MQSTEKLDFAHPYVNAILTHTLSMIKWLCLGNFTVLKIQVYQLSYNNVKILSNMKMKEPQLSYLYLRIFIIGF